MKAKLAAAIVIALMMWVQPSLPAGPQHITSFSGMAKGQGTLTVGDQKSKINSVYINLKENGEADIPLFTDLQLFAKRKWYASDDRARNIPAES